MFNIALALLAAYAILVALVTVFQSRLLYFTQALAPGEAAILARSGKLDAWREDSLRGYLRQPTTGTARGTVVVFHGNAGLALHRDFYADALVPLGFRVILAEYPGYAEKPGSPDEESLAVDAVATLRTARADFPGPLFGLGESLGAGVLAAALGRSPGLVDGAILLTPWDTLAAVAAHHYPYLPVRWMLRDRYDSVANLGRFPGPTVVLVAAEDRVIPPGCGRRLFEELRGTKALRVFPGADHNSWPSDPTEPWWGEIMRELTTAAGTVGIPAK